MHKEEIQNLLSIFGFAETLNKTLNGANTIHMMHSCFEHRKFVEYYIDPLGTIKSICAFDDTDNLSVFENTVDFEVWLKK